MAGIVVLGATGRLGTILRRFWPDGDGTIWQARGPRAGFAPWDILNTPCSLPLRGAAVLCLAGGRAEDLSANTALAQAALRAAERGGAAHVFLASSAAVYAPGAGLDETAPTLPPSPYGVAKLAMERAALDTGFPLTCLRIGNVAGADALLGQIRAPGEIVTLNPVKGSARGPVRSYIGPRSLAHVLGRLCALPGEGAALPAVLNVAAPGAVAMADLLDAAALPWQWGPPNPLAIPVVTLDTGRLQALCPLPAALSDPAALVAEWRSAQA